MNEADFYRWRNSVPGRAWDGHHTARMNYEHSLAAVSTPRLQKTSPFEHWDPQDYLAEYFGKLQEDERLVIRYFVDQMRGAEVGPILLFGCGPGLNHVFLTAHHFSELVLSDYLATNLAEIEHWLRADPTAHDWQPFVRYTLACESGQTPTEAQVQVRLQAIRNAPTALLRADAGLANPLGSAYRGRFATVLSPFCADSATDDKCVWARYSHNIASLVRPGGLLLIAALRRSRSYRVGSRYFPSADIDELDLRTQLAEDFLPETVQVEALDAPEQREQGYSGILLARARKA